MKTTPTALTAKIEHYQKQLDKLPTLKGTQREKEVLKKYYISQIGKMKKANQQLINNITVNNPKSISA